MRAVAVALVLVSLTASWAHAAEPCVPPAAPGTWKPILAHRAVERMGPHYVTPYGIVGVNPQTLAATIYDPCHNRWTFLPAQRSTIPGFDPFDPRAARPPGLTLRMVGDRIVAWSRGQGYVLDLATTTWSKMAVEPAPLRSVADGSPLVVATPSRLLFWRGHRLETDFEQGFAYDPTADRWSPIAASGLGHRTGHSLVVAGEVLYVWGGVTDVESRTGRRELGDGAVYDPTADRWQSLRTERAPSPRAMHATAYADPLLAVWGGTHGQADGAIFNKYLWRPIPVAPLSRPYHRAAWVGRRLLLFGGPTCDGIVWDDEHQHWGRMADAPFVLGSPAVHALPDGRRLLVHSGANVAIYDVAADKWTPVKLPWPSVVSVVWTGTELLAWGRGPTTPVQGARFTLPLAPR